MKKIAIIGVGVLPARSSSPDVSYREMTFKAATLAYKDAQISNKQVDSFVTCLEDFNEGTSIADEYTPDQLGAVLKPMCTVGGDGIHGICDAFMRIQSGVSSIVVVASHSKHSNIETPAHIINYALDPIISRPLELNPDYIAGLEMNRFLHESKLTEKDCAEIVVKNRKNALRNPLCPYGSELTVQEVLNSKYAFSPLKEMECSQPADGACVIVLASEDKVSNNSRPVWVRGVGWCSDTSTLESRDWGRAIYAEKSAAMASKVAGVKTTDCNLFEIDDTYSYKELQHLRAIGCQNRENVNLSGGSLGTGNLLDANGLYRVCELVSQLRGEAGPRQVKSARLGLALGWRGVPTTSGAVAILEANS